jgi:hypothetical protein
MHGKTKIKTVSLIIKPKSGVVDVRKSDKWLGRICKTETVHKSHAECWIQKTFEDSSLLGCKWPAGVTCRGRKRYIDPCYSLKTRQEMFVTEFERFNCPFLGPHRGYISDLFHNFERRRLFIDLFPNTEFIYRRIYYAPHPPPPQKKHNFMLDLTFRQRCNRGTRSSWVCRCIVRCFPTFREKNNVLKRATRSFESQEAHTRISESKFYIIITKQWIFVGSETLKKATMTIINFRDVRPCSLVYIYIYIYIYGATFQRNLPSPSSD